MTHLSAWSGTETAASSTTISLQDNLGDSATYYGSFHYSGQKLSGGYITGMDDYQNNSLYFKVNNVHLAVLNAFRLLNSGNAQKLLNQTLTGNDNITGSTGDDILQGGKGNNTLTGGGGNDTFLVSSGTTTITDLGLGADVLQVAKGAKAIANLQAAWTATAASHNAGHVTLNSNGYALDLAAAGGSQGYQINNSGAATTLQGSAFADTLTSFAVNDSLTGGLGKDTFIIKALNNQITDLGLGADKLQVTAGASVFAQLAAAWTATSATHNDGAATLSSPGFAVNLAAASGKLGYIISNTGAATSLIGSASADTLQSGLGSDTLTGGKGNDTFIINGSQVTIKDLGKGADVLQVQAGASVSANLAAAWTATAATHNDGNATLLTHAKALNLSAVTSGNGFELINTGKATSLTGSNFNDTLIGGSGNDILNGGQGQDVLTGGGGKNVFVFTTLNCTETITDFVTGKDHLKFSAAEYSGLNSHHSKLSDAQFYAAPDAVTAGNAEIRFVYNTNTGDLYYTPQGNAGSAQEIAVLGIATHPVLQYTDIQISH